MSYFADGDDLAAELAASLKLFLATPEGQQAAKQASGGFEIVEDGPKEPTVLIDTINPASSTALILGEHARVEAGAAQAGAHVRLTADGDALHDMLAENYDAGQIARAIEEKRVRVTGPPWSLDALIVLVGLYGGFYRRSLEERQRTDLLNTPTPPPAGHWEVEVPRPEDYVGVVLPARAEFTKTMSR